MCVLALESEERFLDVRGDRQVASLMEHISALSGMGDPREVLAGLLAGPLRAYAEVSARPGSSRHYQIRRLCGPDGGELLPASEIVLCGGLIARLIQNPQPKVLHHIDLSDDPILPKSMAGYRSVIAVPLFVDQTPRDWVILFHPDPKGFSIADLE